LIYRSKGLNIGNVKKKLFRGFRKGEGRKSINNITFKLLVLVFEISFGR